MHGIYQGENRHFRKLVAPSGLAYFYCEYPGCLNRITARYSSRQAQNTELPTIESVSNDHVLRDGTRHPQPRGKFLKKLVNEKIKADMKNNPLKSVKQTHEDATNEVLISLTEESDRQEFLQSIYTAGIETFNCNICVQYFTNSFILKQHM